MNTEGLTIVELVLIIAIIASLGMIIAPMFDAVAPKVNVESEGRKIVAMVRTVQQQAVDQGREHLVRFIQGTDTIETAFIDGDGREIEIQEMVLDRSVDLVSSTFPRDILSFNLLGEPREGGVVKLRSTSSEEIYVRIAPDTGKATLEKDE